MEISDLPQEKVEFLKTIFTPKKDQTYEQKTKALKFSFLYACNDMGIDPNSVQFKVEHFPNYSGFAKILDASDPAYPDKKYQVCINQSLLEESGSLNVCSTVLHEMRHVYQIKSRGNNILPKEYDLLMDKKTLLKYWYSDKYETDADKYALKTMKNLMFKQKIDTGASIVDTVKRRIKMQKIYMKSRFLHVIYGIYYRKVKKAGSVIMGKFRTTSSPAPVQSAFINSQKTM